MMDVRIYGTDWCEDTQQTREHMDVMGIPYDYVNIELDPHAAAWVREQNAGKQKTPTVNVRGVVLTEPSNAELESVLRAHGLLAD